MKKKIVYLLLGACWCSLFSAAKQVGQSCDTVVYKVVKKESHKKRDARSASGLGVDLSPLNFFLSI
jgi:hypothetical protein